MISFLLSPFCRAQIMDIEQKTVDFNIITVIIFEVERN